MSPRESEIGTISRGLRSARRRARQASRLARWFFQPGAFPTAEIAPFGGGLCHRVFQTRICIAHASADSVLEDGKRTNVALAAPAFDGVLVSPSRPLSFWRALGRPTEHVGFRAGVEILGGCLVPSIGGGLCLLSNALFAMAARLGWKILERHGHSTEVMRRAPGDPWGLDATVLWPHLDLRVAPRAGRARLSVMVSGADLVMAVDATEPLALAVGLVSDGDRTWLEGGQRIRENRIVRVLAERDGGRVLGREVVAWNHKRVPVDAEARRTCLTCDAAAGCATGRVALRRMP